VQDGVNMTPWHKKDPERLQSEVAAMRHYTRAELRRLSSGLIWVERLRSSFRTPYGLVITYPERFPYERPKAFVVNPELERGAPHRLSDGSLCLFTDPWACDMKCTAAVIRNRAAAWFIAYEVWLRNGRVWKAPEH
jgi:hypothetical protein